MIINETIIGNFVITYVFELEAGSYWKISDGVNSFTVSEPPVLCQERLRKSMQQYLLERQQEFVEEPE
jgi:hypothetical protein